MFGKSPGMDVVNHTLVIRDAGKDVFLPVVRAPLCIHRCAYRLVQTHRASPALHTRKPPPIRVRHLLSVHLVHILQTGKVAQHSHAPDISCSGICRKPDSSLGTSGPFPIKNNGTGLPLGGERKMHPSRDSSRSHRVYPSIIPVYPESLYHRCYRLS